MSKGGFLTRLAPQHIVIGVGVLVVLIMSSFYIVDERQQALRFRFGAVQSVQKEAGLYMKLPLLDQVRYFDDRVLSIEIAEIEPILSDQRRILVDAFARWRIVDPLKYYRTVGTLDRATSRLDAALKNYVRDVLARQTLDVILTGERAALMTQIRDAAKPEASELGIEVVDVRIRRADLPPQNLEATYRRMNTEREREAADFRARGKEAAQKTRAEADREAVELVSNARRDAEILRGEAEADRNRIIADVFGKDPEFHSFYRSLLSYERSLKGGNSTIVLDPASEYFRYLEQDPGATPSRK